MKSRRALSTVVGTVFAIIALTSTITYVSYSMGILDNYNQSVLTKNQQLSDVNKEKFQISSVTVPNSKLNITVVNTGSVPINFTKIWIQNTTSSATTDWVRSYVPIHNFVVPGGVLTNIGQSINVISTNSYNVKLVTSRGNTQTVTENSASAAKLNIQMMFLPPTISSGFTSELLMVVINNSTGTLTNISPSALPAATNGTGNTGNLKCTAGSVSPASYNTLAPGNAAFFTWTISTVNGNPSDTCTYNLTTPLQNGYTQNVSPSTPLTITAVNLASTTYAQNSGVITNDYTKFKWTQGSSTNTWNTDWSFPSCTTTDFQITVQNNNQTGGGYYLWLSKNSQIFFVPTILTNIPNQKMTPQTYYMVNSVTLSPLGINAYADNSIGIKNQGGIATLYFGAASAGGAQQASSTCANSYPYGLTPNTPYYGSIVLYGKFTKNSGDTTGGNYAQAIPFMAVISN